MEKHQHKSIIWQNRWR